MIVRKLRGLRAQVSRVLDRKLVSGPLSYNSDGLATQHNADFMQEPQFVRAYACGKATGSWGNADVQWRVHVGLWCATIASGLPGDFVECGVNRGALTRTIVDYLDFGSLPKTFFLLDTFCGLDERYISSEEAARGVRAGGYAECYEDVCRTFSTFANVIIVRGAVPDTLPQVTSEQVAFLSIDMNCVEPEIAAAECFWPRMVRGGLILLDDYGWRGHQAQKHAFDRFAKEKNVQILSLPTGQGIIMKPD